MQLLRINDSDEKRWDEYVTPRASSVTELFAWRRIVDEVYRMASHFIAVEEVDSIVGTLGLFEVKHPLFGHYLTTAAFSNDGGFHYENILASDLLVAEAKRLADDLKVDYLLIRTRGTELDGFAKKIGGLGELIVFNQLRAQVVVPARVLRTKVDHALP